jgi:hypothetical protein
MTTRATVKRLMERVRCGGVGVGPLARLTDAQLQEAVANLRAGRPSGINLSALVAANPEIARLSDAEIVRRLAALRTQIVNNPQRHQQQEV